jgi:hypothetical protein
VISELPAHTRERIDDIRAFHVPARRSWWQRLARRSATCVMCGVPIGRCLQLRWVERVVAGEQPPAGWTS